MTLTRVLLHMLTVMLVCMAAGVLAAFLDDRSAARAARRAARGRATCARFLASGTTQRRARAYVDGDDLVVLGVRTHWRVSREDYERSGVRRFGLDEDLAEVAEQRGFVDAAGRRYLLGPIEEWAPAADAMLQHVHAPASRLVRLRAAAPRRALAALVLGCLAAGAFQLVWASGHQVSARVERLVPHPADDYTDCRVSWTDPSGSHVAEVDCEEPYPQVGDRVDVRALAWPFEGKAMDDIGSYEGLAVVTGGVALVGLIWTAVTTTVRLRRPAVRLLPLPAPVVTVRHPEPAASLEVSASDDLLTLLDALAAQEGWAAEATDVPPEQPWYARPLMAFFSARWWTVWVPGLAAVLLPESVPMTVRYALGVVAGLGLAWAAFTAVGTWRTIGRADRGPVTSEWDYRLARDIDDTWFVLLVLGRTPHWMVMLAPGGHPAPSGRCGVRGDLTPGGAVTMQIAGQCWRTTSPVDRVDDELLDDITLDVRDRLIGSGASLER